MNYISRLLLANGGVLLSLLGGTLGTDALVALDAGELAKGGVGLEVLLLLGDLAGSLLDDRRADGEGGRDGLLDGSSALGSRAVTLLGGLGALGEDDELAKVGGEASLVQLKGLLAAVAATVVDADADSAGNLAADTSSLELLKGEATASTDLAVVLDSLATDSRAEGLSGAGGNEGGLGSTGVAAALLLASLVEPGPDAAGPLLVEMAVGELVVVLHLGERRVRTLFTGIARG